MLQNETHKVKKILIIGAGPSGLTCANELILAKKNTNITILDKNDRVGGLARSYLYRGSIFDIGPHRFYTKNTSILKMWKHLLKNNFIRIHRLTRIYYNKIYLIYPVNILDVTKNIGIASIIRIFFGYYKSRIDYFNKIPTTYKEWIEKKFGYPLFTIFFKDYTEKVWGISCDKISSVWAQNRINKLDFTVILFSIIPFRSSILPKNLVNTFYYPRMGAGSYFQELSKLLMRKNVHIGLQAHVQKILHSDNRIKEIHYIKEGKMNIFKKPEVLFTSMPITKLILSFSPPPPRKIIQAVSKLKFRDHITVNLLIKKKIFPDNWVYIHDPLIKMARITNYNSFNPLLKNKKNIAISVEYFLSHNDTMWILPDDALIKLAMSELQKIGLCAFDDILDGFVVKDEDAYPAYHVGYEKHFNVVKKYLSSFKNLKCIGRGGMYKYNNMDQAMLSGINAAKEFSSGIESTEHWNDNYE